MAITGTQVITDRARYLLEDTGSLRWTDVVLLAYLNDGQLLLYSNFPEQYLSAAGTMTSYANAATVGATLITPDRFLPALVDYVCYRALTQEGMDKSDFTRSRAFYNSFVTAIGAIPLAVGR